MKDGSKHALRKTNEHGVLILLCLPLFFACDASIEDLPETIPYTLQIGFTRGDDFSNNAISQQLEGSQVLLGGRPIGSLQLIEDKPTVHFEAPPSVGRPGMALSLEWNTPCGTHLLALEGRDAESAEIIARKLEAGERVFIQRYPYPSSFERASVYVDRGEVTGELRVGNIPIPTDAKSVALFTNECKSAEVTLDGSSIGTWRPDLPVFVSLDKHLCHQYRIQAYGKSAAPQNSIQDLRGRTVTALPTGIEGYEPIEFFLQPLPDEIPSYHQGRLLRNLVRSECPTSPQ